MERQWVHFFTSTTSLDCIHTWGGICARQLLPAEWKITPAPVYSQIFCTQPAICYVVKTDFFFSWQRKINCEEGREFVFILAWWRWVPGWRRTAVGEGWPTRCLLPLPCLAAQSLWQNKPPGILGKHWEPLTGIRTISWEHHSQKALHFQSCLHFFFSKLNCCFQYQRYGAVMIRGCLFSQWLENISTASLCEVLKLQTNVFFQHA